MPRKTIKKSFIWHVENSSKKIDNEKKWKLIKKYNWSFSNTSYFAQNIILDDYLMWMMMISALSNLERICRWSINFLTKGHINWRLIKTDRAIKIHKNGAWYYVVMKKIQFYEQKRQVADYQKKIYNRTLNKKLFKKKACVIQNDVIFDIDEKEIDHIKKIILKALSHNKKKRKTSDASTSNKNSTTLKKFKFEISNSKSFVSDSTSKTNSFFVKKNLFVNFNWAQSFHSVLFGLVDLINSFFVFSVNSNWTQLLHSVFSDLVDFIIINSFFVFFINFGSKPLNDFQEIASFDFTAIDFFVVPDLTEADLFFIPVAFDPTEAGLFFIFIPQFKTVLSASFMPRLKTVKTELDWNMKLRAKNKKIENLHKKIRDLKKKIKNKIDRFHNWKAAKKKYQSLWIELKNIMKDFSTKKNIRMKAKKALIEYNKLIIKFNHTTEKLFNQTLSIDDSGSFNDFSAATDFFW